MKKRYQAQKRFSGNALIKAKTCEEPLLRTYLIDISNQNISAIDYCKYLIKNNPDIEIAEPYNSNQLFRHVPNDPQVSQQTMLEVIKAYDAWEYWKGDTNTVIGVSDNGVNQDHEDIIGNLYNNNGQKGYSLTDGGNITKNVGDPHGLEVAGIACASTNNQKGVAGVGYKCRLFPFKTATDDDPGNIEYGYESIIKAANMGFIKVLNCSWGTSKTFSQIEQSIIDYAISRDVAIVAAAGNRRHEDYPIYPAAYTGVLSVGETNLNDQLTSTSSIGDFLGIMAPGLGNYSCTGNGNSDYISLEGGTSYSSPVVAGALGLVRSKYPELSPRESIEFLRQCGDDIKAVQSGDEGFLLPKRLNLLKAMQISPKSIPSIRPIEYIYKRNDGSIADRIKVGDTLSLTIKTRNYLGSANNLKFTLSIKNSDARYIQLIDSVVNVAFYNEYESKDLSTFKFIVKESYYTRLFLRFDISGENGYTDLFLKSILTNPSVKTFENEAFAFTAADNGRLGYNGFEQHTNSESTYDLEGVGINLKPYGTLIASRAGFVAVKPNNILTSIYGYGKWDSDFQNIKKLEEPNPNTVVFADLDSYVQPHTQMGIEVEAKFSLPIQDQSMARAELKVKNTSSSAFNDFAFGYYFDWDIGYQGGDNQISNIDSVLPLKYKNERGGAQLIFREPAEGNTFPYVATAIATDQAGAIAQSAGFSRDSYDSDNYDCTFAISALNSDKSLQTTMVGDIANMMGAKFPGAFNAGEDRRCVICFGADYDLNRLYENLKRCLDTTYVGVNEIDNSDNISIYPNPAKDYIVVNNVESLENTTLTLYNSIGELVYSENMFGKNTRINLTNLPNGIYFLMLNSGNKSKAKYISIYK